MVNGTWSTGGFDADILKSIPTQLTAGRPVESDCKGAILKESVNKVESIMDETFVIVTCSDILA